VEGTSGGEARGERERKRRRRRRRRRRRERERRRRRVRERRRRRVREKGGAMRVQRGLGAAREGAACAGHCKGHSSHGYGGTLLRQPRVT